MVGFFGPGGGFCGPGGGFGGPGSVFLKVAASRYCYRY